VRASVGLSSVPTRMSSSGLGPTPTLAVVERAAGQDTGSVSTEPSAEAPRASRRARHRVRLDRTIRRSAVSEPSGKTLGPPRTIRRSAASEPSGKTPGTSRIESSAKATRASRLASRRARLETCAAARAAAHTAPSTERSVKQAAAAEPHAIRRSSRRRRYRTEPLRLFAVNPLTVGDFRRTVMWGFILV